MIATLLPPKNGDFLNHVTSLSEITETDFATPRRTERVIKLIRATNQQKSKEIKTLLKERRQFVKRITHLKNVISNLRTKKKIPEGSGKTLMVK